MLYIPFTPFQVHLHVFISCLYSSFRSWTVDDVALWNPTLLLTHLPPSGSTLTYRLRAKGTRLCAQGTYLPAQGKRLCADSTCLHAQGTRLRAQGTHDTKSVCQVRKTLNHIKMKDKSLRSSTRCLIQTHHNFPLKKNSDKSTYSYTFTFFPFLPHLHLIHILLPCLWYPSPPLSPLWPRPPWVLASAACTHPCRWYPSPPLSDSECMYESLPLICSLSIPFPHIAVRSGSWLLLYLRILAN